MIELLVVAGVDAGAQFTVEGEEVLVGRGHPASGQTDTIRLEDKSISRRQAWIRTDASGTATLEHIASASNPTLVNGIEIQRTRIEIGDRIDMGRVSIDVRARAGMNLSGLTELMEGAARESTITNAQLRSVDSQTATLPGMEGPGTESPGTEGHSETTQQSVARVLPDSPKRWAEEITDLRPMDVRVGELALLRGAEDSVETSFPILFGTTRIGRGDAVEVQIPELGVSRLHAEIALSGEGLVLIQKSRTNPTLVNGFPVLDRVALGDGDEIQLADRVVLGVKLASASRDAASGRGSASGLTERMVNKIDLDRQIEAFNVMGSFLDVDVVGSRTMKSAGEKAEHIIVSFERFRAYVGGICEEWDGHVLNSNGDELMCFFESATSAVLAGSAILERLADFNRDQNLLSKDFRFRLGAHTGVSLVDLDAGIAYSEVLDTAGHIQKMAEPNSLLISQTTLDSLPPLADPMDQPIQMVGEMTGEAGPLYRVGRFLKACDFGDDLPTEVSASQDSPTAEGPLRSGNRGDETSGSQRN